MRGLDGGTRITTRYVVTSRFGHAVANHLSINQECPRSWILWLDRFRGVPSGLLRNDTNIYAESDVDIVMRIGNFGYDISNLEGTAQVAFHTAYSNATYGLSNFKPDVV